jgi:PAS domain S-box-containing protein
LAESNLPSFAHGASLSSAAEQFDGALFGAFMKHLPGVAFIKDLEGRYVYYNGATQRLFGRPPEAFIGRTDPELWPPELAAAYQRSDAEVVRTKAPVESFEAAAHIDGPHTWLIHKFPIMDGDQVSLVGGIGIDVTERRNLEDQLTQARKMEALGRLAGGVAHDFNNLLTVISGYCQLALEGLDNATAAKMRLWLQEILNSSRRAAALTGQLLAFSRRQPVQARTFDLSILVRDMNSMLQRMLSESIELRIDCACPDSPCLVHADPHQMEQVIMNLAVNARDAMPLGGALELKCRCATRRPDGTLLPQSSVVLEVSDTGVGMDEKVKAQMFEPFFTSKSTGKGTGLGLSTVYGVISQAGGDIEVDTEPGRGTTFRIYLPLARGPVASIPPVSSAPAGSETILLVEDEASLNTLAQTILRRLGYTVLAAESGSQALELWAQSKGRVDLLLTDVIMPQMSGSELAHQLRGKKPQLKILFMSGYTNDMIESHGVLNGETGFLQKPFTSEKLGRTVREVLDA